MRFREMKFDALTWNAKSGKLDYVGEGNTREFIFTCGVCGKEEVLKLNKDNEINLEGKLCCNGSYEIREKQ